MAHLPKRGETVTEAVFLQTFGGKGANQAVGAARPGGRVALVNCVGDDSSPDTLEYVSELAAAHGRRIMLNLASARRLSAACLRRRTYLIGNESEAELRCGFAVDSPAQAVAAGQAIREIKRR